jgi:GTP-binding protein HflX
VVALNKIDRLEDPGVAAGLVRMRGGVAVSARTGAGLDDLLAAVREHLPLAARSVILRIPHGAGAALASCYRRGRVLARSDEAQHVRLEVELPADALRALEAYRA